MAARTLFSLLRRSRPGPGLVGLALLAAAPALAAAGRTQEPAAAAPSSSGRKYPARIYDTVRLLGKPPVIDGRLDDEAWRTQGEWAGDYRQQIPTEGAPPSQPTELKILYDEKHVYMAVRAYDDPAKVHKYPGRRDALTGDIVGVCFDSYNDKRTGFEFDLTAGGSKIDLILYGETEWDTTWDVVWDGKVAHDEKGWTAEFRVPLNQLRFGPQPEQVWGLHAWRWIDRNQEEDQWQLIPRKNTGRMHQLGELHGIRDLPRPRHLELLPHVVGSASSGPSVPDGDTDGAGSAGLDAKLGLSSNFTLDATVNPDFGQVEADPSVVNLTAYETFYEEKRPFFLEGRKILSFGMEGEDQLFYSRRIGAPPSHSPFLAPEETTSLPESTTILGAFKVTGRTDGGLSVAAMQAFTQKETVSVTSPLGQRDAVVEPFGSYTVGRLHKDWGKGNTSLGAMVTSTHRSVDDPALAFLPTQATTGGIDFTRYFADRTWVLEASGVFSQVRGDRSAITALQTDPVHYYQRPDTDHLGVDPGRTSLSGHGGSVLFGRSDTSRLRLLDHFHWYSPGLDLNDVGYLRQADLLSNQVFLGWSEPKPKGAFRDYSFQLAREDQSGLRRAPDSRRHRARSQRPVQEQVAGPGERRLQGRGRHAHAPRRAGAALARLLRDEPEPAHRPVEAGLAVPVRRLLAGARRRLAGLERRGVRERAPLEPPLALRLSGLRAAGRQPAVRGHRRRRRRPALGARAHRPGHLELHVPGQRLDHAGADAPVLRQPVHWDRPVRRVQARDGHPGAGQRQPVPRVRPGGDRLFRRARPVRGHG